MNVNSAPKPYGPAYQQRCAKAAVAAGCKGNAMGVLYCLFMQSGLWDWDTGQTVREISHKDLGAEMGNLSYNTIQKAVTELRKAGVLGYADHRGRGVVWSDGTGHANRYKLLLPPVDPSQKTGTPPPKKRADPLPKNGEHYHTPYFHKGAEDAPSRRGGDKASSRNPSPDDHQRMEAQRVFNRVFNETHDFGKARAAEQEYLAAAQSASVAAE